MNVTNIENDLYPQLQMLHKIAVLIIVGNFISGNTR